MPTLGGVRLQGSLPSENMTLRSKRKATHVGTLYYGILFYINYLGVHLKI